MADELRGERGEYDWWESFAAGHPELEDATLAALADAERDGILLEERPEQKALNAPPAPEAGDRRRDINLLQDGQPVDVTSGMTDEEVEAKIVELTRVHPKLIGYNGVTSVIAFGVTSQLRDLWCEAWEHYADHGCEAGKSALDRLLEQLIGAFHIARGQTESED